MDRSGIAQYDGDTWFQYMYWHNMRDPGWTDIGFIDGHVQYYRTVTNNSGGKWYRSSDGTWSFIFSD
jgi:hypothetical protein